MCPVIIPLTLPPSACLNYSQSEAWKALDKNTSHTNIEPIFTPKSHHGWSQGLNFSLKLLIQLFKSLVVCTPVTPWMHCAIIYNIYCVTPSIMSRLVTGLHFWLLKNYKLKLHYVKATSAPTVDVYVIKFVFSRIILCITQSKAVLVNSVHFLNIF